ncbi:MAG: hypothetical protein AAGK78_17015, partial [Planctomycetota bacterium]
MMARRLALSVLFSLFVHGSAAQAAPWYDPKTPALFGVVLGETLRSQNVAECALDRTSASDIKKLIEVAKLLCEATGQGNCDRADDPELKALLSDGVDDGGAFAGDYKPARTQKTMCWRRCKGGKSPACDTVYDTVDRTNPLAGKTKVSESANPHFGGFLQRGVAPAGAPLPVFVNQNNLQVSVDGRDVVVGVQALLQPQNQAGVLSATRRLFRARRPDRRTRRAFRTTRRPGFA